MTVLNDQQKQLLFDYCLGLTSEEETAQAEQLISSNSQAAEMHLKFETALSPLKTLESESCPDELAEGTIWRLNNQARSSQLRLEQLLAGEQAKGEASKGRFWKNFGEVLATAAAITLIAGVVIGPLNLARQKSRQLDCTAQLMRIGQGISSYSNDHDGQLPAVATAMGAPWWKVGYQGTENHSNTRHIWLLPKGGYVDPADFVCPGSCRSKTLKLVDSSQTQNYNDFPSRKHVTYSFRIRCNKSEEKSTGVRKVLIADVSPLFERLPDDYSESLKLRLNKELLNRNSVNHKRRGQNLLFCDGSAEFVKTRRIGIQEDDIFTLRDTDTYEGVEVPSCETDAFLAP